MKNVSKAILKLLKDKINSRCQKDKTREDAEQKHLGMTPCFGKGFTLIELLVVVLIIGILSAVALPQYRVAVEKARYTQLMVLVKAFDDAEKIYYMANGTYTLDFDDLDYQPPAGYQKSGNFITWDNGKLKCTLGDGTKDAEGKLIPTIYCASDSATYYKSSDAGLVCGAKNEIGHKVCKSFGGTLYHQTSNITYYKLP
ncbi:type IV pilin protein [Candidatus Avelusimicrobium sp.]